MKALVAQELTGPAGLVHTDVDDVAGGPDTVVVDVRAAGVCFPDLLLISGQYQLKLDNPGAQQEYGDGVARLVADGLRPPEPQRYPLAEGRAALESLAAGGVFGMVVLEPGPTA